MPNKRMLACMAIAAFAAFVVAPAASASPELTESGSTVAVGSSTKGTNTGTVKITLVKGGSAVECNHAEFKGTVTKNNGTKLQIEVPIGGASFKGTATGEDCTSSLGPVKVTVTSKLCFETIGAGTIAITGCSGNVSYSLHITGVTTCKYSAASMSGTFLINADYTDGLSEQAETLAEPNFLCPSNFWIDMALDRTTTDGTTLNIS